MKTSCGFSRGAWLLLALALGSAQPARAGTIGGETEDWSRWQTVAPLPTPGYGLAAGVLSNALYAIGGYNNLTGLVQSNVYRFDGTNWTAVADLPARRYGLAAGTLNGALYALGGASALGTSTKSNVYKFNGSTWTEVAQLPTSRSFLSAGVQGGALYALGGANITNVYRFNETAWTSAAALPGSGYGRAAAELNGILYIIAGGSSLIYTNVYGFNGTSWTEVNGLPAPRYQPAAGTLNGAIYAIGGYSLGRVVQTNVFRFDGVNWTEVPGLPAARLGLAAGVLNGVLYAMGGQDGGGASCSAVFRYPSLSAYSGVNPASGGTTGGYPVVISGSNLGIGGSDITTVTLCGTTVAGIQSQSATQVVVTAGAGTAGLGSVAVYSTALGLTVKSNAFTYTAPANLAPTNILLSGTNVAENLASGTRIGSFSTQDPDAGDTFTYTLAAGTGGTDNGSFTVAGSNLLTAAIFNYEVKSNYSIRIQSADPGSLSTQKVFGIRIGNVEEPSPAFAGVPTLADGRPVVRWNSLTNHKYTVHASTNLLSGFSVVQSDISGTPAMNSYTDSLTTAVQKYWKITTDP